MAKNLVLINKYKSLIQYFGELAKSVQITILRHTPGYELIIFIKELLINILSKNIDIESDDLDSLKKHIKFIKSFLNAKDPIKVKKLLIKNRIALITLFDVYKKTIDYL